MTRSAVEPGLCQSRSLPHVLHVVESWPPVPSGYASRSHWIVSGQSRVGIALPAVLVTSRQRVYGYEIAEAAAGFPVTLLPECGTESQRRHSRLPGWGGRFHIDQAHLTDQVIREAERQNADLIHAHWSSVIGAACARAAQQLGIPLVAEVRFDLAGAVNAQSFSGLAQPLEPLARRWFERHLKDAQVIVSASDALADLLTRVVPKASSRIYSVPNGISAEFLARCDQARRESSANDDSPRRGAKRTTPVVIGTTSKMLRYENIGALLDLLKSIPDTRLLLVGDGPERKRLEARVADFDDALAQRVTFAGVVAHHDIPTLLAGIDVFVVPRRNAAITRFASPIKVVEAMAAGCAIVATAVGDTARLLAEGRGRLIPAEDPLALETAVRELVENADARTVAGQRARAFAASALNGDALLQRYATVYQIAQHAMA